MRRPPRPSLPLRVPYAPPSPRPCMARTRRAHRTRYRLVDFGGLRACVRLLGTFCHTVQCEDLQGRGQHRFVCVKVSKNTKDILDQNLWEVKLLKLLARRVTAEERQLLPTLLNVFYYRETLFIVYELLRDNLYHIYKYIEECHLPKYFTTERLREVARQCLQTLAVLHAREVIHCDLKPENILIASLTYAPTRRANHQPPAPPTRTARPLRSPPPPARSASPHSATASRSPPACSLTAACVLGTVSSSQLVPSQSHRLRQRLPPSRPTMLLRPIPRVPSP